MNKMKIEILVLAPVQTNCYLIQNCETKEILVVDPADRESRIRQKAEEMGGQIRAILLTHGHFDHITAVEGLRRETEAPVYAFKEEAILLADTEYNLSAGCGQPGFAQGGRSCGRQRRAFAGGIPDPGDSHAGTHGGKLLLLFPGGGGADVRRYSLCHVCGADGSAYGQRGSHGAQHKESSAGASGGDESFPGTRRRDDDIL